MKLVPAKCPICGGTIQVDSEKEAAVCEFCKQPFIVEKAINNLNQNIKYQSVNNNGNININSLNIGSFVDIKKLIELSETYFKSQDYEKAETYIDRALEMEPNNSRILFLKACCLSYRQTEKIPPFSFLVLSIKNAKDEKTKESRMKAASKYLQDNCFVLDEYLYEDFKKISKDVFVLDDLYSEIIIKFETSGDLNFDGELLLSGKKGFEAKIFMISALDHYITNNNSGIKLIDIPAGSGNLNFVYCSTLFGYKIKKT